jgi:hypothetical protein
MGIVLLQRYTQFVAQVSLSDFKAYAADKVEDLVEVFESPTRRWKFYTYKLPRFVSWNSAEQWASWLTHHDLRAIWTDEPDVTTDISNILRDAERIGDVDFQDALVDAWMSWLQPCTPAGDLSVGRLQNSVSFECRGRLHDLRYALILHHDADAIDLEHIENADDSDSPNDYSTCSKVRSFALGYFCQPQREPKDPLQLSNEEFCKKHHAHHAKGLPCYKTKSLPKET